MWLLQKAAASADCEEEEAEGANVAHEDERRRGEEIDVEFVAWTLASTIRAISSKVSWLKLLFEKSGVSRQGRDNSRLISEGKEEEPLTASIQRERR